MPTQATTTKLDNRAQSLRDLSNRMDHILLTPVDVNYHEMMEITAYAVAENNARARHLMGIMQARKEGRLHSKDFQQKWKGTIFRDWTETVHAAKSDVPFESLYAHFHPGAGSLSFLRMNPYVFVEPVMSAGSSAVVYGPRSSGKSAMLCWLYQEEHRLKQDHLDNGQHSMLSIMRDAGGGKRRDPSQEQIERQLKDEASVGAKNMPEEVYRQWKERLGLLEAKGVRFVTNIAIRPKSPLMSNIQMAESVSDTWIIMGRNDLDDLFTCQGFDEATTSDDNQRSMTFGSFIVRTFLSQGGKRNVTVWIATQSDKRLRDQVLEEADMKIGKETAKPGFKPTVGWITIRGVFQDQRFTQIPNTMIDFETKENALFLPDVDLTKVWAATAAERRRAIDGGDEWTHGDSIKFDEKYIMRNRLTLKELKEGKNPFLRAEIRQIIEQSVTPDMLQRYSDDELGERLASRHTNIQDGPRKFIEELTDWFRPLQKEKKEIAHGKKDPKVDDPDAVQAAP